TAILDDEKLPVRSSPVSGKALVPSEAGRTRSPSYDAKKNTLSCRIGPPAVPPNWFWINCGFSEGAKKFRALSFWFRRNSQALPCSRLVPDRVITLKIAPALRPYSALNPLVRSFISCSASGGG